MTNDPNAPRDSTHSLASVQAMHDPAESRCAVWGVLNVTPDSFSDGGRYDAIEPALAHAERMLEEGADVIDVGGESSRPAGTTYGRGAQTVAAAEEIARVRPVIAQLASRGVRVSVDTVKGEVARAAIAAGARIVNDVSGGLDPDLLRAVADAECELVLMHTRDRGRVEPHTARYQDVVGDVLAELAHSVDRAIAHGVRRDRIWIDPGLGFAKTAEQSAQLLARLDAFVATGHRVLVGASRKSFLAAAIARSGGAAPPPDRRRGASVVAVALAALAGVHAVRVHDVADSVQAARVIEAIREARRPA